MSRIKQFLWLLIGAVAGAFLGLKFEAVASISVLTTWGLSRIPGGFVWGSLGALIGDKIGTELGRSTITRRKEIIWSFSGIIFGIFIGIITEELLLTTNEISAGLILGELEMMTGMIPFAILGGIIGGVGGTELPPAKAGGLYGD